MNANWMIEMVAIAVLLGAAAFAAENVLRRWRMAGRWVWFGALAGSAVLPWLPLPARRSVVSAAAIDDGGVWLSIMPATEAGAAQVSAATTPILGQAGALALVWAALSLMMVAYLVTGQLRLRRLRLDWRRDRLEGVPVWISEDVGPAVVGWRRQEIVLPRWMLGMNRASLRLTLRHEQEHIRARDGEIWLAALAVAAAFPWNPGIWWTLHRLRGAIEQDCDQRVLQGSGDVRVYGSLLLEVARRGGRVPLAAAAMASRPTQIERRVRAMTARHGKYRAPLSLAGALTAVALFAAACETSRPVTEVVGGAEGALPTTAAVAPEQRVPEASYLPDPITPTPADESPQPPPDATDPPPPAGSSQRAQAAPTAELPTAPSAEDLLRTRPAPADTPLIATPDSTGPAPGRDIADEPVFTPRTVDPTLRNRQEFVAAMERGYPPMLRDAGIGGTTVLWVFIDEEGFVRNARIVRSSGTPELDQAAERLLRDVARFTPAQNLGEPVPVWVQLPVTFQTR